ncbi:glycosyltransferase [Muricoccus pecuniae]|uniref:Glycosyltransferase involved in cell wall biosynthesis n=1 Tax=Muricoccus pecuniae TaxID=693023 RepID=A0A840Y926_9PROT|nr:glycosyltransferase [Roseomonas pecuniae]MBB5695239.1 glycosyltransferase involved in cell wall biosynthesis [Roseomonas pecuniae]
MSGLRIGWATPWNGRSAIADAAAEVGRSLAAQGHRLTVLRTEVGEAAAMPPHTGIFPVEHIDALDDDALRRRFDVVVAHIGNHHPYHGALVPRLRGVSMIGIFHDFFLGHLAAGHFEHVGDPHGAWRTARDLYGPEGMRDGEAFWADLADMVRRRPMLDWLASHCAGAVAHSGHYAGHLRRVCPGPVEVIPLAFTASGMPPFPSPWDRITVAAIGHANPNKRLDQIVLAIGSSGLLRRRCRLRVIGEAAPAERARLTGLAELLGAEPPEFTGWVDDEDLRWRLRDVDVIACLRNPVLEGASASVITAMASGRPTLVTDHGCYAEIPAGTVLSCRPEEEALDAMRHLEWVLANPAEAAALGARAREVALERHAPTAYAAALVPLMERVVADRPRREARRHLFSTLGSLGLGPEDPAARRAEGVLAGMGLEG